MIEVNEEVWNTVISRLQIDGEDLTMTGSTVMGTHSLFLGDVKIGHYDVGLNEHHIDEDIKSKYAQYL